MRQTERQSPSREETLFSCQRERERKKNLILFFFFYPFHKANFCSSIKLSVVSVAPRSGSKIRRRGEWGEERGCGVRGVRLTWLWASVLPWAHGAFYIMPRWEWKHDHFTISHFLQHSSSDTFPTCPTGDLFRCCKPTQNPRREEEPQSISYLLFASYIS